MGHGWPGRSREASGLQVTHRHCSGGRGVRGISARTACGSIALVFSSTTFSGMRSAGRGSTQAAGPEAWGPARPPSAARPQALAHPQADLPLTLVLDEAVGSQKLQRVHLEQHAVEEEAVGRGPAGRVPGQAGEDELLWTGGGSGCSFSVLAPSPWEPSCSFRHRERHPVSRQARTWFFKQDSEVFPGPGAACAFLPVGTPTPVSVGGWHCHPQVTDEGCTLRTDTSPCLGAQDWAERWQISLGP